jgi:hypothetical protein
VHLPQRAGPGRLVRDDLLDQPEQPEQEGDLAVVAARATAATPDQARSGTRGTAAHPDCAQELTRTKRNGHS